MNFFESQDQARRKTKYLVMFFGAAVLSIVVLTNLLVLAIANYNNSYTVSTGAFRYSWETFALVSLGVLVFIGLGSLYRIVSLGKGGQVVAEMMNARLLVDHGGDLGARRLLNIVEEMAIASGTPVPPVYVMDDPAINAFAAGYAPGDAVIAVTRGAIENLNREQLQGVIAHEFSHILNGDMRLNIRLMGVLYGILMLAILGRILLRSGGRGRSRRNDGGAALLAFGLGLVVIGFVGRFFGNLIKAAVSRQREFLADASAVQFTRNPGGISGALKRIGGYSGGSLVADGHGEEISHAFFCQGVKLAFTSLMATHPPLDERILRIEPSWDGRFIEQVSPSPDEDTVVAGFASGGARAGTGVSEAADRVGEIHVEAGQGILASLPRSLAEAAREPYSARAVAYLMLLDSDVLVSERQRQHLAASADPLVFERFQALSRHQGEIMPHMRLPLLELAMPSLRQLSREQYETFTANLDALIAADGRVGLTEWALRKFVVKHLGEAFDHKRSRPRYDSLGRLAPELATLLSMLAFSDRSSSLDPASAFEAGRAMLEMDIELVEKSMLTLTRLNDALDRLAALKPLRKPKVLKACMATVAADGVVAPVETELVRAIADSLDCPMPPVPLETASR
ncbi:MAG: M48 family metallopeptidase [Pseudomonadales bacterium]|nr:M48 family metallopeptidase [Pseudomonadales bacterium]